MDNTIKVAQQNSGRGSEQPGNKWKYAIGGEFTFNHNTNKISAPSSSGLIVQGLLRKKYK